MAKFFHTNDGWINADLVESIEFSKDRTFRDHHIFPPAYARLRDGTHKEIFCPDYTLAEFVPVVDYQLLVVNPSFEKDHTTGILGLYVDPNYGGTVGVLRESGRITRLGKELAVIDGNGKSTYFHHALVLPSGWVVNEFGWYFEDADDFIRDLRRNENER